MAPSCGENSTDCILPRSEGIVLVESVASVMTTVVCFVGNTLVCICVYRDKHLRTVQNLFIVNIAITNVLLSTTVWPFWIVTLTTSKWPANQVACNFQGFMNHCLMTSLVLTITIQGMNRYIMLVYPFRYRVLFKRKNAYRMLVIEWFLSIVWASARFVKFGYNFLPEIGLCESKSVKTLCVFDFAILLGFTSLTIFCYWKVFAIIRRHVSNVLPQGTNTRWPPPTGPKAYYYEEVNFTKTSLLIFFAYGISWLQLIFLGILMLAGALVPRNAILASWFFVPLSCSSHPIINIASNKRFRKGFYHILCSCGFNFEANITTREEGNQPGPPVI